MRSPTAQIPGGYHGGYLRVDISRACGDFVALEPALLRRYLGGCGLGTALLLREGAERAEPYSPESVLAFVFSPLVGSSLTTSAKFAVVSKSPLTGRLNDSLASSHFAIAGKSTGCDAIAITGRAPRPSVVVIDNGQVRLEPAGDLWGLSIPDAEHALRQRFGPDFRAAVIGPAGERLVRYATLSHDGRHAGRGGSGAVLGAKNVKAVLVRGRQRCPWAHPQRLAEYAKSLSSRSFGPETAKYRELGTAANLLVLNRLHALPTRNFQQGSCDQAAAFSPESLAGSRQRMRTSCAACTIGCEHIYSLNSKFQANGAGGTRVEYESLFALGPLCGVTDPAKLPSSEFPAYWTKAIKDLMEAYDSICAYCCFRIHRVSRGCSIARTSSSGSPRAQPRPLLDLNRRPACVSEISPKSLQR